MSNQQIVPDQSSFSFYLGADSVQSVAPQIPNGGGAFDCTGYGSTGVLEVMPTIATPAMDVQALPYTVVSAGPGGFVFSVTSINLANLIIEMGGLQYNGYIYESDGGGDTALLWTGVVTINANNAQLKALI